MSTTLTNMSTRDRFTGDQATYGAKCSRFSFHYGWFIFVCYPWWLDLPSITSDLSWKPVPPPSPWSWYDALVLLPRPPPWPDWECVMMSNPVVLALLLTNAFTEDECFQAGENWWESLLVALYCSYFICFYCKLLLFSHTSLVMENFAL